MSRKTDPDMISKIQQSEIFERFKDANRGTERALRLGVGLIDTHLAQHSDDYLGLACKAALLVQMFARCSPEKGNEIYLRSARTQMDHVREHIDEARRAQVLFVYGISLAQIPPALLLENEARAVLEELFNHEDFPKLSPVHQTETGVALSVVLAALKNHEASKEIFISVRELLPKEEVSMLFESYVNLRVY